MTETMMAAVLERPGAPLRLEEVRMPEPKHGEVLVRVAGCGVCHTDLHVIKGEVAFPTPGVLGHEVSGTVAAWGPGVTGLTEGMNVVCSFIIPCGTCTHCVRGRDDLCLNFFSQNRLKGTLYDGTSRIFRPNGQPLAMYSMGGLAQYAVVPANNVFALPAGLPLVNSSILGCAVFTAYGAVRHAADLRHGDTVAVYGSGGIGSNLIQVARALGASQIIAVDIRDDQLAAARALGATDTINSRTEDVTARLLELTSGRGVDVAFEARGLPETMVRASEAVTDGGKLVAVGIADGRATAPIEITRLVRRSIQIIGSYGARTRTDMPAVLQLAQSGAITTSRVITRRGPLEEAAQMYDDLDAGRIVGRAVIDQT
ncbi:zinc-binding dehydrogenase [Paeniglutamicibacter cryotolerans]|uniref:S-(Hydroxymethyl)glutathione dehydrogenase/alcohol dehydrogenase n=1 Tax=Paeniglutamicibacter cryotolerans TaxID=670079 RepID=A0A839QM13_9MICC|nr:zinc-binding dehydrogenase [Paeniglutamicibacter cryotolerans]MBB2995645.1 S-(hydroxymethyl)glutathione dehydrogenase/alcohol dehydrogenase [Paeniglutamicibacter cryotolerans]